MYDKVALFEFIQKIAKQLGCLDCGISQTIISPQTQQRFNQWIEDKFNGDMDYLAKNRDLRFNPTKITQGSISIICVKVPYLTIATKQHQLRLHNKNHAYISSYALGRDYHKVVKQILNKLANEINNYLSQHNLNHQYRVFSDSAPIMEVELATTAGLGWRGKNTLLINSKQGSSFFLGELFTNLELPVNQTKQDNHCGSCSKCLEVCPTKAFISPYVLDATKCISYLTIENKGTIPHELRPLMGNRIYGCDDCQLFCPWNKFSQITPLKDFAIRHGLHQATLLELFNYSENEFHQKMQGSPIYRIGYLAWIRNIAVGIGNSPYAISNIHALQGKLNEIKDEMVKEHIEWAINQQIAKQSQINPNSQ